MGGGLDWWSVGELCAQAAGSLTTALLRESMGEKHGSFVTYLGSREGIKNGKMAGVVQLNKTSSASLTGA